MESLELEVRANLANPVSGVLSTRDERRGGNRRSTKHREKNRVEELVELHVGGGGKLRVLRTVRPGTAGSA